MASVINRGPNKWLLKWDKNYSRNKNKKGRSKLRKLSYLIFRGNKTEALRKAMELESAPSSDSRQGNTFTVKEISIKWLKNEISVDEPVTPKTLEGYRQKVFSNIIPSFGNVSLPFPGDADDMKRFNKDNDAFFKKLRTEGKSISKKIVRDELLKRFPNMRIKKSIESKEGLAPATVNGVRRVLSMIYDFAIVEENALPYNPLKMKRQRHRGRKGKAKKAKVINKSQVASLLKYLQSKPQIDYRNRAILAIVVLGLCSGARQAELLALHPEDIDLVNGGVWIRRAFEHTNKETRIKETKSYNERFVPIITSVMTILRGWLNYQRQLAAQFDEPFETKDRLLFPRHPKTPKTPMDRHGLSRVVSNWGKIEGLNGYSFHCLRHSNASLLLSAENPVPVAEVSARLGHANTNITQGIYTHFVKQDDRAVNALDNLLTPALEDIKTMN